MQHISANGRALVEHFEGCRLTAYQDKAGVWTIGYGHTGLQHKDGTVYPGRVITLEEADTLLSYDMQQFEHRVEALVKVDLTQAQFDALVSFDFNTGGLTLRSGGPSTLLKLLNGNKFYDASAQFDEWNKVNGTVLAGLSRRRHAERDLFCGFDWTVWKD
jgi:lysozyme